MKLDQLKEIKRLIIYFFYDKDGIVDRYVPYMLEDLNKNCSELFVVCNGVLMPEGRKKIAEITPHILVRDNVGFDVWAYKTALEQYGWDKLAEYDEVVMMNHTIMGPVYPFAEMFGEMDKRDVDFWGITKYHEYRDRDPFGTISYGYIPEHIQSHFIAVRNPMLTSKEYRDYWDNRPEITCYGDAVGKHEAIFTKSFHDKGFSWDVYVDTSDLEGNNLCPLIFCPKKLIEEKRCPILKRRSFFHNYYDFQRITVGEQGRELMDFLRDHTEYDTGLIWENALRTTDMCDIKRNLDLDYILPNDVTVEKPVQRKIALAMHIYFEDMVEYCYQYAQSMPPYSDILITTDSAEKKEVIEKTFTKGNWAKVTVIEIENRGRDVSALLIGLAPYLDQYDYVCFMHDKKVTQLREAIAGVTFSERCFRNLLGSKDMVNNILALLDKEPNMGLLCPPPPNFGDYYRTVGGEWGENFDRAKELSEKLKLKAPIHADKPPVAPLGTMFWFRPKALEKLLHRKWQYSDFPKEPNNTDGTILHSIERLYPYVAQDAGYYSAWVLSTQYARSEWNNLEFSLRELNVRLLKLICYSNLQGLLEYLDYQIYCQEHNQTPQSTGVDLTVPSARILVKRSIKEKIPKPIWKMMKRIYHFFGGKKWVG